ncbi:MAG: hypothetical protein AAF289_21945, partial [Cyanobacteria bacterium P01_A01_bin.135]
RSQVETAYEALQRQGMPTEQIDILGDGYKSADQFGLINPDQEADKQSLNLVPWLIPFGFGAGYLFNLLTDIRLFQWAGAFGNHVIGGLFGAAAAGMGAYFTGRLVGWTSASGDAIAYRNRLNQGKYVLIVQGSDDLVNRATLTLQQFQPENLQGYQSYG